MMTQMEPVHELDGSQLYHSGAGAGQGEQRAQSKDSAEGRLTRGPLAEGGRG